jgi:6,7-dimethyl-8-ribityllumazine synthase
MDNIRTVNGDLVARDLRFAIVAARFNDMIVDSLIRGAVDALLRHGAGEKQVEIIRVPGAYDLPFVVKRVAGSKRYDAVVALDFDGPIGHQREGSRGAYRRNRDASNNCHG